MPDPIKPLRPHQCATCAYRGRFDEQPADIQAVHRDWMQDGDFAGHPHACHSNPEYGCAGCQRWTEEATSASNGKAVAAPELTPEQIKYQYEQYRGDPTIPDVIRRIGLIEMRYGRPTLIAPIINGQVDTTKGKMHVEIPEPFKQRIAEHWQFLRNHIEKHYPAVHAEIVRQQTLSPNPTAHE